MKKLITLLVAFTITCTAFSQSDKYEKAMQVRLAGLDTIMSPAALRDISAAFERIAEAEKTQWLPYYYASLTLVNAGLNLLNSKETNKAALIDPLADKAEQLINKAASISQDNSEIFIVKKMISSLRMWVDPMNRYMQYSALATQALETARKLNPENPRVYLLEGQDKFFTPEQFGGSKTEAKRLFELSLQKYEAFRPESALAPDWGKRTVHYFLNQLK